MTRRCSIVSPVHQVFPLCYYLLLFQMADRREATSIINIVTDVWILALPMRTLVSVKRPTHEKIALIGIFGAGLFSTIVSMIRLNSIHIFTLSSDPFHDAMPVRTLPSPLCISLSVPQFCL